MKYRKKCSQISQLFVVIPFYILLGLTFLSFPGNSQEVRFKHLNINDGLSQNAVFSILKDSKGFMWFGTKDGLNRYDGYNFVIYQRNPFDSTTLSSNYINCLFEDSRGLIWVGTIGGGLNVYERSSEIFYRIDLTKDSISLRNDYEIKSITEDAEGNIWVGSSGDGLFQVKVENGINLSFKVNRLINNPGNPNSISSNQVFSVLYDKNGFLWMGTFNGLNKLDLKTGKFSFYSIVTKNKGAPENPASESINSVFEAKDGTFWIGTLGGLVKFNRTNGTFIYYPHQYDVFRYGWGNIKAIEEDKAGNLWLASSAALMKFDPVNEHYSTFTYDPYNMHSVSYNSIASICIDDTDILWVGTTGMGVDYFDPRSNRFSVFNLVPDSLSRASGFSVRSILEDNSGDVWISAEVLYKWNRKNGKVQSFERSSNEPSAFGNTIVFSMLQSTDGNIWAATFEGLFRYHPKTGAVKLFKYDSKIKNGLPAREVYAVYQDRDGTIWIATEKHLSKLADEESGIFQSFIYYPGPQFDEQVRPVIFQDINKQMWLGTKYGLFNFNVETEKFTLYENIPNQPNTINNNLIKSICADPLYPERYLWIGTVGGLNRYDNETKSFYYYTEENGLPNNVIYGILPDDQNNLWLSTNKGISRFNLQSGVFRNYDVKDGLQSNEFNTGAYYKSKNGELFFGGINGLNYFYPLEIGENKNIPQVVLTKIKLAEESLSHKTNPELLEKSVEETKRIILSHKEDIIIFEFAALEFSAPGKNQYAYKLENFNNNWINTEGIRSATYTHLPPGEYVFRVKASNSDGIWNNDGLAVELIITPPWTNTWFAYITFGLGLLLLIVLIRNYEVNRLKLKNQLEIEKVSADSLRQIDQVKSQFFTNISHEFRTPLTLILGQLESVLSAGIKAKEKAKLHVANRSARRLLTLINQLLDLSKLEAGNMKLEVSQYNIVSFLKNLFYSFESMTDSKKIDLILESESDNIQVVFDLDKMEKIFYNLVSNAIKYTPEQGKVIITIKTVDSLYVEIYVKDTGAGIPEKYVPFIFNRFYQVESSSTRNYEGTGIGLALVKELIDLHSGTISVKSKVGEGTVFHIKIPVGNIKSVINNDEDIKVKKDLVSVYYQEKEIAEEELEIDVSEEPLTDNREIVLIVEDNKDVRAYIHEQLKEFYQIKEAENGEVGTIMAQETLPDLIVTDLMMPKVDGFEFCKAVRNDERTSHIPIVMLTAKTDLDDKIEGLEIGIDDYITKPFSAKELKVRVRNLIAQRRLLRERFKKATVIKPTEVTAISIDQVFLEKVISNIEANFENQEFTTDSLANSVNMSVSQLNRKLNALINQPAGQLMRSLRLQRAADLLKQNAGTIAEVCYQLDFNDPAYFSRAFKKQFGCSPSDYIKN